jgi:hypothetical protein
LTDHLAESRILVRQSPRPLVKILLSLAETIVESGAVKDPLEFYKELANHASPWIALRDTGSVPTVKLYQICSPGVRRLSAALALCPQGIRSDRGEAVHIALLISAPSNSVPSYLALLAQSVRLLQPFAQREALVGSNSPAEAWELLYQWESEAAPVQRP